MGSEAFPVYALTGCTAVGKTDLALDWAEANDAEIVSCDSLLFYRGMDIGTAKPTREEQERVRHHLIDLREPNRQMDIGEYLERAIETLRDIRDRGKKALVTGGSGFYLKAFFEPVVDTVNVSEATKAEVARIEAAEGLPGLLEALLKWDPDCRTELDPDNPRRVARALERCLETGKSIRQLRNEFASQSNELIETKKRLVVLERDRDSLNRRIGERVKRMLSAGLIDEVERLKACGFEANASAAGSIGYRETLSYINGEYGKDELAERIETNTRRLAKKQRTWFRTQLPEGKRIDLGEANEGLVDCLFQ